MKRLIMAAMTLAVLVACGGAVGPQKNGIYFWQLTSSTQEFGACSDATDFRANINPIEISDSTFIIYKVSADGRTAHSQTCTQLKASTCSDTDGGVVFDVAGSELTLTNAFHDQIENSTCFLDQLQTWTLTDQQKEMTLNISNVLTLTPNSSSDADKASCTSVEASLKSRSPNMLGVEGCVITGTLKGELK